MKSLGKDKFVSCEVGGMTLGIELDCVQEINRLVDATEVPRAPGAVRGLVNLRGNLVTVLDLGVVLHGAPIKTDANSRTVVVDLGEERIGLLVERVGDVVSRGESALEPLPRHIGKAQARWFNGLIQTEKALLLVLDVDMVCDPKRVDVQRGEPVA